MSDIILKRGETLWFLTSLFYDAIFTAILKYGIIKVLKNQQRFVTFKFLMVFLTSAVEERISFLETKRLRANYSSSSGRLDIYLE